MVTLMLTYANGHNWTRDFARMAETYAFANGCVCLTNGKIVLVQVKTEAGSVRTLWRSSWTSASKQAGLRLPA